MLVKVLVDAFNQEKVLVEAFSVIVETSQTFVCSSTGARCEDCRLGWFLLQAESQWAVGVSSQSGRVYPGHSGRRDSYQYSIQHE